ncbi:MAG: gamma carbonic anhydrase family protein [Frankiales bacterium]|jgi:carbonic anhydrase/acetyltransferase-like protein (isoleucine patch superfamily)|nr:gamma carbonic anhydrase family protein [Frankiales bacterium]MCW2709282.1 gamma carbonic anhydrase family protein [Frankiales bacterium]
MRISVGGSSPEVDPTAWVAPDAVLAGAVTIGPEASVWYATVIRGDGDTIRVGARSNIQDGCVLHTDPGLQLVVGEGVSVGHRAVLHGCVVEDDVLIGMGAIVMNGAHIGTGSLVAAGALVTEGTKIPPRSLVVGAPAKVRREVSDDELEMVRYNATHYVALARTHPQP